MNILDKIGAGLSRSIDTIVDKNRETAQLNRLNAVIKSETETVNRAYIALGKQYHKILEGTATEIDMTHVCAVIESSKIRLKKAQARYDYIKKYGLPKVKVEEPVIKISANENISTDIEVCNDDDDDEDITIAYADNTSSQPTIITENNAIDIEDIDIAENPAKTSDEFALDPIIETVGSTQYVAKSASENEAETEPEEITSSVSNVVAELKKKHSSRKKSSEVPDSEVENDSNVNPIM